MLSLPLPGCQVPIFTTSQLQTSALKKHRHLPVSQSSHSWSVWQRHLVLDWTWTKKQHENCNKMKQQLFMTFITIHSLHCIIWTHCIPPTSKFLESEEFHTSTILWIVSISLVRLPRNLNKALNNWLAFHLSNHLRWNISIPWGANPSPPG